MQLTDFVPVTSPFGGYFSFPFGVPTSTVTSTVQEVK